MEVVHKKATLISSWCRGDTRLRVGGGAVVGGSRDSENMVRGERSRVGELGARQRSRPFFGHTV